MLFWHGTTERACDSLVSLPSRNFNAGESYSLARCTAYGPRSGAGHLLSPPRGKGRASPWHCARWASVPQCHEGRIFTRLGERYRQD